jgi:hypothetical protein
MFRIKNLQQRLAIFLILPLAIFLAGFGVAGYLYLRGLLLQEWQEAAILRLERTAHLMDMRLVEPIHWMGALAQTGGGRQAEENRSWILQQLEKLPGRQPGKNYLESTGRRAGNRGAASGGRSISAPV